MLFRGRSLKGRHGQGWSLSNGCHTWTTKTLSWTLNGSLIRCKLFIEDVMMRRNISSGLYFSCAGVVQVSRSSPISNDMDPPRPDESMNIYGSSYWINGNQSTNDRWDDKTGSKLKLYIIPDLPQGWITSNILWSTTDREVLSPYILSPSQLSKQYPNKDLSVTTKDTNRTLTHLSIGIKATKWTKGQHLRHWLSNYLPSNISSKGYSLRISRQATTTFVYPETHLLIVRKERDNQGSLWLFMKWDNN